MAMQTRGLLTPPQAAPQPGWAPQTTSCRSDLHAPSTFFPSFSQACGVVPRCRDWRTVRSGGTTWPKATRKGRLMSAQRQLLLRRPCKHPTPSSGSITPDEPSGLLTSEDVSQNPAAPGERRGHVASPSSCLRSKASGDGRASGWVLGPVRSEGSHHGQTLRRAPRNLGNTSVPAVPVSSMPGPHSPAQRLLSSAPDTVSSGCQRGPSPGCSHAAHRLHRPTFPCSLTFSDTAEAVPVGHRSRHSRPLPTCSSRSSPGDFPLLPGPCSLLLPRNTCSLSCKSLSCKGPGTSLLHVGDFAAGMTYPSTTQDGGIIRGQTRSRGVSAGSFSSREQE